MSAPLEVPEASSKAAPEAVLSGGGVAIEGRSLGQIAWIRLKRDRWALTAGVIVVLLILIAVFAPVVVGLLGHPPNEFHPTVIDPNIQTPLGKFGGINKHFLLGA